MRYFLYNLILAFLAPVAAIYLLLRPRYWRLLQRFFPRLSLSQTEKVIWIHACSVGEVMVAKVLLDALHIQNPTRALLLTVNTLSGYTLAREKIQEAFVAFAPFDLACGVRHFIQRVNPVMLVLLETELWPNLVRETGRRNIPVLVVNGRISPRKFPSYRKYKAIMPPVFSWLTHVAAQDALYRERFTVLGVSEEKITITGNLKFDGAVTSSDPDKVTAMRHENGFGDSSTIIIFGSTRPGDEELAAACWKQLKDRYPELVLIVAPRHLHRMPEVLAPFKGESLVLRSEIKAGVGNKSARLMVLDTMGELSQVYALCQIAVIGGSFFAGVEGHNPLEPAALGIPTVFGPYMGNFQDAATLLIDAEGALQVAGPDALLSALTTLLDDPVYGRHMGNAGRQAVLRNQGATKRTLDVINTFLE